MTRAIADAHETARARDAQTLHAYLTPADTQPGDAVVYLGPAYRTRTHAIDPTTGEFTRLDQESDTMTDHRAEAERIRDDERRVVKPSGTRMDGAIVHALLAIHDTLAEIRDLLPERATLHDLDDVAAEFGVDLSDVDPAPADVDPDEELAKVLFEFNGRGRHDDQWSDAGEGNREFWLDIAHAAREHIYAETDPEHITVRRDDLEETEAKADRYDALREDLEDKFSQVEVEDRGHMPAFASRVLKGILARDTERAES